MSRYGNESQRPKYRSALGRVGGRWAWMTVIGISVFVATYMLLVRTYLGQYLENSVLLGAEQQTPESVSDALDNLRVISVTALAVAMVAYALVGLLRKSWRIALAGMAALGVSAVVAEVLKRFLLTRPDLAPIYQDNGHNSFPSGHTTIAMAILVSLLLVVSYRWRGLAMFVAMTWAIGVGSATVTARWHRVSDTIGGDMVALAVGALVALWLLRSNAIRVADEKRYPLRVIFVVFIAATAALMLVAGIIIGVRSVQMWDVLGQLSAARAAGEAPTLTAHLDPQFNENMYLAGQALAYAFSAFSGLWFWLTFHHLSTHRARALSSSPATNR